MDDGLQNEESLTCHRRGHWFESITTHHPKSCQIVVVECHLGAIPGMMSKSRLKICWHPRTIIRLDPV